ncbi:MAG: SGNH/GDSL hydrolase family protein [Polyangiaceae bacterium]|nr:SGNH/GDSL hydrolase family protein [Polyangiaceae bacterium]
MFLLVQLLMGCGDPTATPRLALTQSQQGGGSSLGLGGNAPIAASGGAGGSASVGFGGSAQVQTGRVGTGGVPSGTLGAGGTGSGGGASLGGSGGSEGVVGGASAYQACPGAGLPCRVLPLGDSITFGVGSTHKAGYRLSLFRAATEAGKAITFVGSGEPNGPSTVDSVPFPQAHEGHSGYTIAQLQALTSASLQANKPHVILLHIGTNDAEEQQTDRPRPSDLSGLIDQISAQAPEAFILVAQIIPLTNPDAGLQAGIAAYNEAIPNLVASRAASGMHIAYVNMNAALAGRPSAETMVDDYHPNDVGYEIMGATWFAALVERLR